MAVSLNRVQLVGNLGRDPEVRNTQNGSRLVNLNVATSESWKDRNSGERRERTEWHRVVIFNEPLGDIAEKYLHKGSRVYLEGELRTRKWEDQNGNEKYTTEVVLAQFQGKLIILSDGGQGGGSDDDGGGRRSSGRGGSRSGGRAEAQTSMDDDLDDEIPF